MVFVSGVFLLFFIFSFALWWLLPPRAAKPFLVAASLFFYSYWFPPHVLILLSIGLINFFAAREIGRKAKNARRWFFISISFSLGMLAYFKYANFFISNLNTLRNSITGAVDAPFLQVILPLGISFYTFQALSYSIDVYKGRYTAATKLSDFLLYLAFFPQLVAGPIVRAVDFIPQIDRREFPDINQWRNSIYRITRGFFLKLVIADNVAQSVNSIFNNDYHHLGVIGGWLGALFFGVQIFCDFAGYSDIAIGLAGLFGFNLKENFDNPYISLSISEFWRRWHISMTSWFRDYVYYPLARSTWINEHIYKPLAYTRLNKLSTSINTMVMFLLSGLWHGANWKFVLWGGLHGIGIITERQTGLYALQQRTSDAKRPYRWLFGLISLAAVTVFWVPFRAPTIQATLLYWQAMFSKQIIGNLSAAVKLSGLFWLFVFTITQVVMVVGEKLATEPKRQTLHLVESWVYFALTLFIAGQVTDFVYFQF